MFIGSGPHLPSSLPGLSRDQIAGILQAETSELVGSKSDPQRIAAASPHVLGLRGERRRSATFPRRSSRKKMIRIMRIRRGEGWRKKTELVQVAGFVWSWYEEGAERRWTLSRFPALQSSSVGAGTMVFLLAHRPHMPWLVRAGDSPWMDSREGCRNRPPPESVGIVHPTTPANLGGRRGRRNCSRLGIER
ncbi:hypothetical protein BHE74_00049509 [Ensete ventricosum]|nr:hypothetical protein BHE74_00049509 [Ensete ventricosum]